MEKRRDASEVIKLVKELDIKMLRLQFTDILGGLKNVGIPAKHVEEAMDGGIMFDGSSIEGFVRIEESDMLLRPDPDTFAVLPWKPAHHKEARLICDVHLPDGTPFEGDPRGFLKRMMGRAEKHGLELMAGPEAEFFLFEKEPTGDLTTRTHDYGGYFDLTPVDKGEEARRDMVETLELMGFEVEAAHHEVAHGQHEIDFRYADALRTADQVVTFKMVVKTVAMKHGLHASFMPKPVFGINGSGMHTHQSLFHKDKNVFFDAKADFQLSEKCLHYIGGLMAHARAFTAFTNPLVNSYKRLVPGYEAPVYVTWAEKNRSPMIRVPASRGNGTRVEVRSPDPSCNPYLSIGLMLCAGLDGLENQVDPGPPMNRNLYAMNDEERERLGIATLPGSLLEALDDLERDTVLREALGEHIMAHYLEAKHKEWDAYRTQVHQWELDQYLAVY